MDTKRSTRGQMTVAAMGLAAEQAGGSTNISDRRGEWCNEVWEGFLLDTPDAGEGSAGGADPSIGCAFRYTNPGGSRRGPNKVGPPVNENTARKGGGSGQVCV